MAELSTLSAYSERKFRGFALRLLLLLVALLVFLVIDGIAEGHLHVRFELFVVLVLDRLADALVILFEVECVVGDGIGGEPVLAVDLLSIRLKLRKLVVRALLDQTHAASVALDDLQ